jgi:hypothetical protein
MKLPVQMQRPMNEMADGMTASAFAMPPIAKCKIQTMGN